MKIPRKGLPFLALVLSLVGVLGEPVPAQALYSRTNCFQDYATCIDKAAQLDGFWRRSVAGLDCYVDLVWCVKNVFA
jgi:hypothetical protein